MTQQQHALAQAMDQQRPFSWVKSHDIQAGVYLKYSQMTWALVRKAPQQ